MGSAMHKVVTTERYEFTLRSPAAYAEVLKAVHWASQKFAEIKGREVEYDDDIWVEGDEEEITVYFTHEVSG